MGLIILFGGFALLTLLGMPVAFALAAAALGAFLYEGIPAAVAFQQMTAGISIFTLLAIPFFVFAGEVMQRGGIALRIVDFASAAVGRVEGGLGIVTVLSNMMFGGISGSAVADVSATGAVMIPAMRAKGYHADYAVNVTITSSIAGIMFPPSHNMILYSLAAGGAISITRLFLAGVVPGLIMCLLLAGAAYLVARRRGYPQERFPGIRTLFLAGLGALPGLFTAVIIIGGSLSGIFTVTESGAVGAIYALLVTALVYRSLSWQDFRKVLETSIRTTAMVMVAAAAFGYLMALYEVPARVANGLTEISANPLVILLLINLVLLFLGCIMDMAALILICTPIFLPLVQKFGMDPVQFGMLLMMNLGMGLTTPPVGSCLFVGCAIGGVKMEQVMRSILPFYAAILVALALTTYIPAVSLSLPRLVFGN
ncbi:MAG TPA: TRAP transporter large permease [Dongiaceae bacterium]